MKDWIEKLNFFKSEEYENLKKFIAEERKKKKEIFPEDSNIFNALKITPLKSVKVVIIGQDPYDDPGYAHGLSFSLPESIVDPKKFPRTFKNILKELNDDVGVEAKTGNLTSWAKQGVLLLNRVLTVENNKPNSHKNKGWETLTDEMIDLINSDSDLKNVVFVLWGKEAQKLEKRIDTNKHKILKSPHPSGNSAYKGFFGSKPFSSINSYLKENNIEQIDWSLDQ